MPYAQSDAGERDANAQAGLPTGVAKEEKCIDSWQMLRSCLDQLILESGGAVVVSRIKDQFRSLVGAELSETAFGHTTLTALLRDERLGDAFVVDELTHNLRTFRARHPKRAAADSAASIPAPTTSANISQAPPAATTAVVPAEVEDVSEHSVLQLCRLPHSATLDDVRAFLGSHTAELEVGPDGNSEAAIQMQRKSGRFSGLARVQFTSPEAAVKCRDDLHLRTMADRYVEVIVGCFTRDRVVKELRVRMADPSRRRMLLSMLGSELSAPARAYLKRVDSGLRRFLAQFPSEFSIEGGAGREYVNYTPVQDQTSQSTSHGPKPPTSP